MNYKDFPLKEEDLKIGFKYSKFGKRDGIWQDYTIIGSCYGEFSGYDDTRIKSSEEFFIHQRNIPRLQIFTKTKFDTFESFSMIRKDLYDILYENFKLKDEYRKYKYE